MQHLKIHASQGYRLTNYQALGALFAWGKTDHNTQGILCDAPGTLSLFADLLSRVISKISGEVTVMVEWAQVASWPHAIEGVRLGCG